MQVVQMKKPDLVSVSHRWLTDMGHRIDKRFLEDELVSHADYPGITALADFLEAGGIQVNVVKASSTFHEEFNYPLLAHFREPGRSYLSVISDPGSWKEMEDEIPNWTGIVLYLDKGAVYHHAGNDMARQQTHLRKLQLLIANLIGLCVLAGILYNKQAWVVGFGVVAYAGLYLSLLAFATEMGMQGELVKQMCGTISKGGCEKVLKSKHAAGIGGIKPADFAIIYFVSQLVCMTGLFARSVPFSVVSFIAFGGLLVAAWSIYTQARKIKQWCVICLGISACLLIECCISFLYLRSTSLPATAELVASLFVFILVFLASGLLLMPVKSVLSRFAMHAKELRRFNKWKADPHLFTSQLQKEPVYDHDLWEDDLIIGNPDASLRVTIACNPYCDPCAREHLHIDELIDTFPEKICIHFRLLCDPLNPADKRTKAVQSILSANLSAGCTKKTKEMLRDWFTWMDHDKWTSKWLSSAPANSDELIEKHDAWLRGSKIEGTPTAFINGRKLPKRYAIKDLYKFIPELAEFPAYA